MRHGQSKMIVGNFILSHPENAKDKKYSLSEMGKNQAKTSVQKAKDSGMLDSNTIIYCSTFYRAKQTARIAKKILGVKNPIIFDDRLIDRWFGDFEKTPIDNYNKVWEEDKKQGHNHNAYNAESVLSIKNRVFEAIKDIESKYKNKKILIVSHGDPMQIIQTFLEGRPISLHREARLLKTAEIRELK